MILTHFLWKGETMKEYITISETERQVVLFLIAFLIITGLILCYKGMKLEIAYNELKEQVERNMVMED